MMERTRGGVAAEGGEKMATEVVVAAAKAVAEVAATEVAVATAKVAAGTMMAKPAMVEAGGVATAAVGWVARKERETVAREMVEVAIGWEAEAEAATAWEVAAGWGAREERVTEMEKRDQHHLESCRCNGSRHRTLPRRPCLRARVPMCPVRWSSQTGPSMPIARLWSTPTQARWQLIRILRRRSPSACCLARNSQTPVARADMSHHRHTRSTCRSS